MKILISLIIVIILSVSINCTVSADKSYSIPSHGGSFKSYTHYRLLNRNSPQWKKIQCNKKANTSPNGLRRVGKYYCVAMGQYYSKTLGDVFEIKTKNGKFKVIICDWKATWDTDSTNRYTLSNGCVIEFYVDTYKLPSKVKQMGDVSYANKKFKGKITKITKLGNYFKNKKLRE